MARNDFDEAFFGERLAKVITDSGKDGSIAAVLSTLVELAAAHRTQAQNAPHISSIFPSASTRIPSKLAGSKEDLGDLFYVEGRNIVSTR